MREVMIAGIGQTPVGEHWDVSLRDLAHRAIEAALIDAGDLRPQALYIGNYLASVLSHQANLGALFSDYSALSGIEAYTVEASTASGAGALRMGYLAVASGFVDTALVLGVEKYTDAVGPQQEGAVAMGLDTDYEGTQGLTLTAQAALLMRRYLHEYGAPESALAPFPLIAHANGAGNPNAMYRKAIKRPAYESADPISDPVNLFDMAPYADGAAALVLTHAGNLTAGAAHPPVRIRGSAVAIDTLAVHDRPNPLGFDAARISLEQACRQAGILPGDADLFELSDAFSVYAALSLEAAGLAQPGQSWKLAEEGAFDRSGRLPIATMGGLKARGNPLGATGVYQAVEAVQQLRGEAGPNQIPGARLALVQTLGGAASTAITHVFEAANGHN
ncbi:MAG TPA: thiolase domain-containing protein [Anaerolineaceae bacterium]|nr:thiolase domain-containing protein [Anaerolineaceae bacterium]